MSNYPYSIDDSLSLPITTDNVTPVKAEVPNKIRDAVIAIENELGIDPSSTFGTVRARLDALSTSGSGTGAVEILQDGTILLPSAIAIDFAGNVNVTISQPLRARVEITGGQTQQIQTTFIVLNGQTTFTLSENPIQPNAVMMFINGIKQQYTVDYSVTGTTVSYLATTSLMSTDKVELWYLVDVTDISLVGPQGPPGPVGPQGPPGSGGGGTSIPLLYGNGVDGDIIISSTIALTQDLVCSSLHVTSTGVLQTQCFRIFSKNTITVDTGGIIELNGLNANGITPGGGTGPGTLTSNWQGAVGGTATGTDADPIDPTLSGPGGNGGNGSNGSGGSGGTANDSSINGRGLSILDAFINFFGGGPGGGGGGGDGSNAGAAGGDGGGYIQIWAPILVLNGTISATGGNGGNAPIGDTGGGGGGSGGKIDLLLGVPWTGIGTINVAGGFGGTGHGTGTNGGAGSSGAVVQP